MGAGGRVFIFSLCNTDEFLFRGGAFCSESLTSELQTTGGMQRERAGKTEGESDRMKEKRGCTHWMSDSLKIRSYWVRWFYTG